MSAAAPQRSILATEHYFQALAGEWDRRMVLDEQDRLRLEQALGRLQIRRGDVVIDAGCGTGILFPFLSKRIGARGRVTGIDLAAGMIDRAREKFAADRRFRWQQGDVVAVLETYRSEDADQAAEPWAAEPWAAEPWAAEPGRADRPDRIVCFSSFPHFPSRRRALRAFFSALNPGGRFAVIHLKSSAELNRFHAALGRAPVRSHRLPSARRLGRLAGRQGFRLLWQQDEAGLFLVIGEKSADRSR